MVTCLSFTRAHGARPSRNSSSNQVDGGRSSATPQWFRHSSLRNSLSHALTRSLSHARRCAQRPVRACEHLESLLDSAPIDDLNPPTMKADTATRSLFILLFLLGTFWFGRSSSRSDSVPAKPNIILMMCDDLGWGDVGFNGGKIIQTPHLDAMAKAGLKFNRFYAAAPVCSPTRGSCITGRHPFR